MLLGNTAEEFSRYLTVAIVGGGPTGVEFAGELCDFVREDLKRLYPNRARAIRYISLPEHRPLERQVNDRVILIEAQEVLGSFDTSLREYAAQKLTRQGVHLVKVCLLFLLLMPLSDGDPGDSAGGWAFVYSFEGRTRDPFRIVRLEHRGGTNGLHFESFNEQNGIRSTCHRRLHASPQTEHR